MSDSRIGKKIISSHSLLLLAVFVVSHLAISIVQLMMYGGGHPLTKLVGSLPIFVQVIACSIYAFVIYSVIGYLLVIAYPRHKENLVKGLDRAALILAIIFLVVFLFAYIYSWITIRHNMWVIYTFLNPIFGTLMFTTMKPDWMSLLWIVSAIIPSVSLAFGMFLRLKHEGVV
ncbi:hypothetical protein H9L01_02190 [Erysipelothrix inopinata]|uniref:Uncharacterized protein n=1 Tax=Erysipelothrix inopinata TaxID=225084 RepID=A0A7G9S023_9FIRM|nr:hypothetical protein [Erysipelothrix inopinata]QNN61198.1 hypothetical protein H9L01_02190 [Erysipelothrix inopinata]